MADQLAEMPDIAKKIQAVYEWNILHNGKVAGVWSKLRIISLCFLLTVPLKTALLTLRF